MKKLVIFAAATMLAVPAIAADAIVYAPEAAPVEYAQGFNWSGAYIGAHAGYGWGNLEDINNPDAERKKIKGALGGLQAGYNWQFDNNVVLGAEADVSFGNVKKNWTDSNPDSSYYTEDKIGTHGTVRARLGYAADRFLPYVTGGLAWANSKHTLGCTPMEKGAQYNCSKYSTDKPTGFESSNSKTKMGWTIGAGAEYAVDNNWSVKAEYLYINLGKSKVSLVDPYHAALNTRNFKTSVNEVRVGVNYKF